MKLHALGSKDRISRREFLKIIQLRNHVRPFIDKEKCTGCGLCTMDCPTRALILNQTNEKDTYQLLFRQEACNACGACEKSCPENCLQLVEEEPERNETGKEAEVIFEDNLSRCMECGIPLFPRSMVKKMETKISMNRETTWPFELCPSCRMKTPFTKERAEKIETRK
jgi:ferredoxin